MIRSSVHLKYPLLFVIIFLNLFVFVSNIYASDGVVTNREIMEAIMQLRGDITEVKAEIKILKSEIKRVDQRIDNTNKRIDDMKDTIQIQINDLKTQINDIKTFMLWGFGILFGVTITSMIGLVGFILWDRRTTLAPVTEEVKKFAEKEILLEKAIIGFSKKHPELKKELKLAVIL